MEELKQFLDFLKTWYGILIAAAGTAFPFSAAFFKLVKRPTLDQDLTAVFSAIVGVAIVAIIFLLVGTRSDRKSPTRLEIANMISLLVIAIILFLCNFWLQNRYLIGITQGNNDDLYYFIRGDEDDLKPFYHTEWNEGKNASFTNYLKNLGYTSYAHGEVFNDAFISRMSLLFLVVFSATWGAFTGLFTFVGAIAFRRSKYDKQKRNPGTSRTKTKQQRMPDSSTPDTSPPSELIADEESAE